MSFKIIQDACCALGADDLAEAKKVIDSGFPFVSPENPGRTYSDVQKTKIYLRDGFIDRYSGEKLIFPPVLRLLSKLMPEEFPYHKNWKMSECHIAYWQLLPTIDHIVPVARGGRDDESNWVCTSQLRNSAKSNWLLAELGWELHGTGDLKEWDGLIHWFIDYTSKNRGIFEDKYFLSWFRIAENAVA
ncbi:MAG: HNH endonuclease signature motif containing protein [Planctomycetota bacterium]